MFGRQKLYLSLQFKSAQVNSLGAVSLHSELTMQQSFDVASRNFYLQFRLILPVKINYTKYLYIFL